MKPTVLKKYLCVVINCWCLIFTGLPSLAFAQPTTNNKPMTAAECPNTPGSAYYWDSNVNRCVLKASSTAQREMFEECDALEADQKAACYERMRNQNLNDEAVTQCKTAHGNDTEALKNCISAIDGSSTGMANDYEGQAGLEILGIGIGTTVAALSVANMLAKSGKKAKGCTSATMLKVTGIGSLVGQLYLKLGVKGNFDELEKNYDEQVAAGDDAQFAAYDYLEAEQKEIESVAEKHEKVYNLTSLGYGATGIIAGVELMGGIAGGLKPCVEPPADQATEDTPDDEGDDSLVEDDTDIDEPELSEKEIAELDSKLTPEQKAAGFTVQSNGTASRPMTEAELDGAGAGVVALRNFPPPVPGMLSKITGFLNTSAGILTLSIAGALINTFLKNSAAKQGEKAKENAEKVARLRSILQETLASSSYCKSRDDLSQPRCYCFNPDNSRNTNRTNSETCQALFANLDRNLFAEANDYGSNKTKKPQGCFRVDGVYDQDCKCKEVKNAQGQDGCFNVPVNVNQVAALGPNTGIPNVVDSFNSLFSGGLGTGELQSGQLGNLAARVGATRKQVLDNLSKKTGIDSRAFKAKGLEVLKGLSKSIPVRERARARSQLASTNVTAPAGLVNNPEIQKSLEKSGIVISSVNRSAARKSKSKGKKKTGFDLYGNGSKTSVGKDDVMAKKYDYSEVQDDIVERKDVSIWKVISNRYNTSGLRRLFDDN